MTGNKIRKGNQIITCWSTVCCFYDDSVFSFGSDDNFSFFSVEVLVFLVNCN